MLEINIENPVVHKAVEAGYFVRKVSWLGRRNAPDRVFSRADRGTVWIEFKKPGKTPNAGQRIEHEEMRAAGMEVHYCDSMDQALRLLWLR